MNINTTLLANTIMKTPSQYGGWRHDLLEEYSCFREDIDHFLTHDQPFLKKQKEAIDIIQGILTHHGKEDLLEFVAELARVEHGIQELEPWVRDHVVHALLSFVLGVYVNELFLNSNNRADKFQWKIAGLLHDVGYPVQIAKDIMRPFSAKINGIKNKLRVSSPDIRFSIVPIGLEKLTIPTNSFELIQRSINDWGLNINVIFEYQKMIDDGEICHGIISSLAVLYVIDLMYTKNNPEREYSGGRYERGGIGWSQEYFEQDIVPACSAIFIHNLPSRCFKDAKIDRNKAPIAFLLKLSDCLQDWQRPSRDDPTGIPSTLYDIGVVNGNLVFTADIDEKRKDRLRAELYSSLVAPDLIIE